MTGTTGKNANVLDEAIKYMDRVRKYSKVHICAGFGIRSSEQVTLMTGPVGGIVVASALVEVMERGEDNLAYQVIAAVNGTKLSANAAK